jgi:hypothetical protein
MHGHGSVVTPRWRQPQARTFFIECVSEDEMLAWIRAIENEEQRVGLAHALLLPPHAAVAARERTRQLTMRN